MENGKDFLKLFKKYKIDNNEEQRVLTACSLFGVKANGEAKELVFTMQLPFVVDYLFIEKIAQKIKGFYDLQRVQINVKYESSLFQIPQIYPLLMGAAKRLLPMVNGFLTGSDALLVDDVLKITLKNNSSNLLTNSHLDMKLSALIKEQFDLQLKVEFINLDHKEFLKEYNEKQAQEIKRLSDELPKPIEKPQTADNKRERQQAIIAANPEIIMGKPIKDNPIGVDEITDTSGIVTFWGDIFGIEQKTTRTDKLIVTFNVTDYKGSIIAKLFGDKGKIEPTLQRLKEGMRVIIRGEALLDRFVGYTVINPKDITQIEKQEKKDNAQHKRVELHCHTAMSALDAVTPTDKLIERAAKWGHKAIAITDHGVAQAFPDAMNAAKKNNIKVLYGVESYFVNDTNPIVYGDKKAHFEDEFIVFDIETTGLVATQEEITEIGAVLIKGGEILSSFNTFVNPQKPIPTKITDLTGITDAMVKDAPLLEEALKMFYDFVGERPLVAHNAPFDISFIKEGSRKTGLPFHFSYIDTVPICRYVFPSIKSVKLHLVAEHIKLPKFNHHRASDDATVLAHIFFHLLKELKEKGIESIEEINGLVGNVGTKNDKSFHQIILVKNYTGLKNLYKLISASHLTYFYKKPRMMKSLLMQHREGLILGSACEAGELYKAVLEEKPWAELCKIAEFYDYLEIQPLGNNQYLIEKNIVDGADKLREINKTIVRLGEHLKKPVVATGDVHFLEQKDEVFRRILMAGQGYDDADKQAPLYFKTTDEMLEEFSYLGKEKAFEVVVTNTNVVADWCEEIRPIPKEAFPPEMEGAEEELKQLTVDRAVEIYGSPLPKIVEERMEKELNSIIKHGFSVMYMIAQKLVYKSLSDGYLVGSRGSVGSSLVAFLSGITEVNSLCPHYVCPHCKKSEFYDDGTYESGVDMEDKNCPNCTNPYKKDGHDIPFETFLGFDGDKAPDIDLNFSGEYQSTAHKYTEELFGEGYVFRAGTISTIADKTAFGFVKKYFDAKNTILHKAEIQRLVNGCTGIKRTTGQHPGGVMIVPKSKEIFDFCPIQRPADDVNSEITTTHFDYHSIHDNLLKLDILGHDDPTVIRMLESLTGIDAKKIPLDDKETMSIFTSTKALKIEVDEIIGRVGSFAVPEFGTKFVRQMLVDTKPTTFAELVRISGLSHGTDVWINNAQELVEKGTATLKEAICTRDDIMTYLIHKGLPKKEAFSIMEGVRKGKGLTPNGEELMKEFSVPEWYIDSCKKIKYMFPKAHAVAYVTMAFRIAYFKVHHPMAFYAAYFTVRADAFDAAFMTYGAEKVKMKMKEIEEKDKEKLATNKEKDMYTVLEVCYEMYKRGLKFVAIDLYKSDAYRFILTDEGLLPPLNALQGLGTNAAASIAKERENGTFMSVDDLKIRTGSTKTVIEVLTTQGVLDGMDKSSQMSLF